MRFFFRFEGPSLTECSGWSPSRKSSGASILLMRDKCHALRGASCALIAGCVTGALPEAASAPGRRRRELPMHGCGSQPASRKDRTYKVNLRRARDDQLSPVRRVSRSEPRQRAHYRCRQRVGFAKPEHNWGDSTAASLRWVPRHCPVDERGYEAALRLPTSRIESD